MEKLTERQIIGAFYKTLEQDIGGSWIDGVSNYFLSDQASEEYAWLGMTPAMREWVGGRNAKGFKENSITIINKHYEATIDILIRDLRRDKSGQAMVRINEMAQRANAHWASLLSTLILAGTSTTCYDGQFFFDTDHSEGDSGTQDNDISIDISALEAANHGSAATAPSVEELQICIMRAIQQIAGFVDDRGEPMNENAQSFLVMVPMVFMNSALQAVDTPMQVGESQTALTAAKKKFSIEVVPNVRLSDWTASFAVFRTDSNVKAFVRQEEQGVQLKVKGENSEYAFDNDAVQYGIDTWRNVAYGYWQNACFVTMT